MSTPAEAQILFEQRDLRARALGRVAVMVWHETPRKETIDALRPKVVAHHEANPKGVALIVAARGGPPNEEARKAFREMVRAVEASVIGVGVLVAVGGLRGTIVRGAVSAAVLALGLPFSVKVFETPREVALHSMRTLRDRGLEAPSAADVEQVLVELQKPLS